MDQGSNRATAGEATWADGPADGRIVSLGDGGRATYALENPLSDGPGPDFAVFENGFKELTPPYLWFLELAFVEVSSDGEHFVRFPAVSKTQNDTQVPTFGQLHPDSLHNLAGKYPLFEGTPFDLAELEDSLSLEIHNITHIRIIDVVGSIHPDYASFDALGNRINDPFPTPFFTGGFDLDAVGLMQTTSGFERRETRDERRETRGERRLFVYPNPCLAGDVIRVKIDLPLNSQASLTIRSINGKHIHHSSYTIQQKAFELPMSLTKGNYVIHIKTSTQQIFQHLIVN